MCLRVNPARSPNHQPQPIDPDKRPVWAPLLGENADYIQIITRGKVPDQEPLGVSLDDAAAPVWADDFLSLVQAEVLARRTQWLVLIDQAPMSPHAHHVGLRLHAHTLGKESGRRGRQGGHSAWPSVATLAECMKVSENTARKGLKDLTGAGWLLRSDRWENGRQLSSIYTLAWPISPAVMLTDLITELPPKDVHTPAPRAPLPLQDVQGGTAGRAGGVVQDVQGGTAPRAPLPLQDVQGGTAGAAPEYRTEFSRSTSLSPQDMSTDTLSSATPPINAHITALTANPHHSANP